MTCLASTMTATAAEDRSVGWLVQFRNKKCETENELERNQTT